MRCRVCGHDMKEDWEYCPRCGSRSRTVMPNFNDIFSRVEKQMKDMDKDFEKNFEIMDLSPLFKDIGRGGKGFSIKITRAGDEKPKVEVKKFGEEQPAAEKKESGLMERIRPFRPKEQPAPRTPKTMEEPKTDVRKAGNRVIVDIHLPGVKSEKDILIRPLENSIEVKAFSGDKAYFKILTKPANSRVTRMPFSNGILRLEIA